MKTRSFWHIAATGMVALVASVVEAQCVGCAETAYWEVRPTWWAESGTEMPTPELERLQRIRPRDLGIAFSGGGTRSAAASIGQLRGLEQLGWLSHVRYISAISGGSWTAVPFVYGNRPVEVLLGTPHPLNADSIRQSPDGLLAANVVKSGLGHLALYELPNFVPPDARGRAPQWLSSALDIVRAGVRRFKGSEVAEPDRRNKAFAHVIGEVFLKNVVDGGRTLPYAWDTQSANEMSRASGRAYAGFVVQREDRPFLIVGGTMIKEAGPEYPRLIPVEYTPLYTGVRQRFGMIGGTYVWPWAYDRLLTAPRSADSLLVGPAPGQRPFTLADVIASSGAAPQLALLLGDVVPERYRRALRRAAEAFPSFTNVSVRNGVPNPVTEELPHGDGGFVDNLGIMPLLVRQVRNIIVFVNAPVEYERNVQLQSYFVRVNERAGDGDKTMNAVFDDTLFVKLIEGLRASTAAGEAAVYCGRNWRVSANELYNFRGYDGLNICWVYNHAAPAWKALLPDSIQLWLDPPPALGKRKEVRQLEHFPFYATFGENRPRIIKLSTLQVNLLAELSAWSVTNPTSVATMRSALDPTVLPP